MFPATEPSRIALTLLGLLDAAKSAACGKARVLGAHALGQVLVFEHPQMRADLSREIGVRMAIGAGRAAVLRIIVARGVMLTVVGLGIGAAGSVGLPRFARTLLFGVSATLPWVFTTVAGLVLVVAVLANVIPGRRATGVDPIVALRVE